MTGAFGRRAAAALALLPAAAAAQRATPDWPTRQIRIVVPYVPGSSTDLLGRLIADRVGPALGQTMLVDNRSGGGSTIGTAFAATAPADGHTLLVVAVDLAINEGLLAGRLPYDASRDFAPVAFLAWSPTVFVTHPGVPARSFPELVALARARPGAVRIATGGIGTGAHVALELFKQVAGVDMLHVPYRGIPPALTDLLGGQVEAMFVQVPNAQGHLAAGRLVALATPSPARLPALPAVPTIAELGWPGFDVATWFGLVAPAGTPAPVVARLNAEVGTLLRDPRTAAQLASQGMMVDPGPPEAFGALIRSETERWTRVIRAAGIRPE